MASHRTASATAPSRGSARAARGRPKKFDDDALLSVAREVFLESGIRATTLEVAERAGVSEGVLFHRFKSKEGLFRAAMKLPQEAVPALLLDAAQNLDSLKLEDGLLRTARAILNIGRVALPLMMMSWSNPALCNATPFDHNRKDFQLFVERITAFFRAQMDAGNLRAVNPELIARSFLGALHHYSMTRIVSGGSVSISEEKFTRGLVDLLLHGAAAGPSSPVKASSKTRT